ncbi:MAG: hypothetical protein K6F05_05475 [Succinivibrio sp.]|nr:hypothetical protein [Succinivibrio sp.]
MKNSNLNLIYSLRYGLLALALSASWVQAAEYETQVSKDKVSYVKPDGSASCELAIQAPEALLPTTKAYAQYVMDSYQGWDLQPIVDLRGFVFKFVDNAPCAGLLTYYDGRSYLFFKACGNIGEGELSSLFKAAGEQLKLSEKLQRQSHSVSY